MGFMGSPVSSRQIENIFCIEEAGNGFGHKHVKKYEINVKKYENNMNFGALVGRNRWGSPNIGVNYTV